MGTAKAKRRQSEGRAKAEQRQSETDPTTVKLRLLPIPEQTRHDALKLHPLSCIADRPFGTTFGAKKYTTPRSCVFVSGRGSECEGRGGADALREMMRLMRWGEAGGGWGCGTGEHGGCGSLEGVWEWGFWRGGEVFGRVGGWGFCWNWSVTT